MLESVISRDGCEVFKLNGRLTCSAYHPLREAEQWVIEHQNLIQRHANLIVTGLGSGFHVKELLLRYPQKKIVVIEKCMELIERFQRCFTIESAKVCFVTGDSIKTILSAGSVRKMQKGLFGVLSFFPAMQDELAFYIALKETLLFRNFEGMQSALKIRPDLKDFVEKLLFQFKSLKVVDESGLLSVKDGLQVAKRSGATPGSVEIIFNILGELVS